MVGVIVGGPESTVSLAVQAVKRIPINKQNRECLNLITIFSFTGMN
jgi:hypothetical protein